MGRGVSKTISLKLSDAMYHALTEKARDGGQVGNETTARACYVRKAVHQRLNQDGWKSTFLRFSDEEYSEWAATHSRGLPAGRKATQRTDAEIAEP